MSTNPYKSFIPYTVIGFNAAQALEAAEQFGSMDPSGGQWRTMGFVAPQAGEQPIIDLQGAGYLCLVQFNERILPGKVRDEQVKKVAAKLEDQQGRKVSKKEYAQLREQVEFDLLPRAFIRRTVVPVFFTLRSTWMLVCTGSQKRADDAVAVMKAAFGDAFVAWKMSTNARLPAVLTTIAKDSSYALDDYRFDTTNCAVMKGEEKRTVRVKDKDISDSDVQAFLSEGYEVSEIGLELIEDGETDANLEFTVTDQMIFKRVSMPNIKAATVAKDDFVGFAVLCVQSYRQMLTQFIEMGQGLQVAETPDDDPDAL
jgi:recombination associated protein RdgC